MHQRVLNVINLYLLQNEMHAASQVFPQADLGCHHHRGGQGSSVHLTPYPVLRAVVVICGGIGPNGVLKSIICMSESQGVVHGVAASDAQLTRFGWVGF